MREQIVIRKPYNWFQIATKKRESLVAEATEFYVLCLQRKASYVSAFCKGLLYTSDGNFKLQPTRCNVY